MSDDRVTELSNLVERSVIKYLNNHKEDLFTIHTSFHGGYSIHSSIANIRKTIRIKAKNSLGKIFINALCFLNINKYSSELQRQRNEKLLENFTKNTSKNQFGADKILGDWSLVNSEIDILLSALDQESDFETALYTIKYLVIHAATHNIQNNKKFLEYVSTEMEKFFSKNNKSKDFNEIRTAFYTEIIVTLALNQVNDIDALLNNVKNDFALLNEIFQIGEKIISECSPNLTEDFEYMLGQYILKDANKNQRLKDRMSSETLIARLIVNNKLSSQTSLFKNLDSIRKDNIRHELLKNLLHSSSDLQEVYAVLNKHFDSNIDYEDSIIEDYFMTFNSTPTAENCRDLIDFIMQLSTDNKNIKYEKLNSLIIKSLNTLLYRGDDSYKIFISQLFEKEIQHVNNISVMSKLSGKDKQKSLVNIEQLMTDAIDGIKESLSIEFIQYLRDRSLVHMSDNLHYFNSILEKIFQENHLLQQEFISSLKIKEANNKIVVAQHSGDKSFNIDITKIKNRNKDFPILSLLHYRLARYQGIHNSSEVIKKLRNNKINHKDTNFIESIISHICELNIEDTENDVMNNKNIKIVKNLLFEATRVQFDINNKPNLLKGISRVGSYFKKENSLDSYKSYRDNISKVRDKVMQEIIYNIYNNLSILDQKNFLSYIVHCASQDGIIDRSKFLEDNMQQFLGKLSIEGNKLSADTCTTMLFYDQNEQVKLQDNNKNYLYQSLLSNNFAILNDLQNMNLLHSNIEVTIDNINNFRNNENIIYHPMNILAYSVSEDEKLIFKLDEIDLSFISSICSKYIGVNANKLTKTIMQDFVNNIAPDNNSLVKIVKDSKSIESIRKPLFLEKKSANIISHDDEKIMTDIMPRNYLHKTSTIDLEQIKDFYNTKKIESNNKFFELDKIISLDDLKSIYGELAKYNIDFDKLVQNILLNESLDRANKLEMVNFIFNSELDYQFDENTLFLVTANKIKNIIYDKNHFASNNNDDILAKVNDKLNNTNEDTEELIRAFFHSYGMSKSNSNQADNDIIMKGVSLYLDDQQDTNIENTESKEFISSLIAYAIHTDNSKLNKKLWSFLNNRVKLIDVKNDKNKDFVKSNKKENRASFINRR